MAVYTHFGGMPGVVRAITAAGFARLVAALNSITPDENPMLDLVEIGRAYLRNARENPHLYLVMFGGTSLGAYRLSQAEQDEGRYTFDILVRAVQRTMDLGVFRPGDAYGVAGQYWSAIHGFVVLELAGHHRDGDEERILDPLLNHLSFALLA